MDIDPFPDPPRKPLPFSGRLQHYYGDVVRRLFLAAGVTILIFAPIFPDFLPLGGLVLVLGTLAFASLAGFTNPKQRWVSVVDVLVSALSLVAFESISLRSYADFPNSFGLLFVVRQGLAILFFFALYYSVKTVRGLSVK